MFFPEKNKIAAIFTSQNGVDAFFLQEVGGASIFKNVFCVGQKTAQMLFDRGVRPSEIAHSSADLAARINNYPSIETLYYFMGNLGFSKSFAHLQKKGITLIKKEVYHTKVLQKKLATTFDAVLFFSPSAVRGYVASGNDLNAVVFCIGDTTASEATAFFETVITAKVPTVEAVLERCNGFFSGN